ncbi:MAG: extracellular solute-binding protein [Clostridiales bacterium]|jgi:raffinose/stachyose/melibiose transport system substrate-binding protein|nr:extracellular solute-binding protein [Clostridiales bacterium]
MKRILTALLLLAFTLSVGLPAMAEETPLSGKLVIWEHTPQFEEAGKAVIAAFLEKHPGVEIDFQVKTTEQYYNLLATAFTAGDAPDLFWTNGAATTNMGAYAEQGLLMPLDGKLDVSLFDDKMLKIATINDTLYASPTAESGGRACYYNKDIFAKLNLEVPKTFDEFEALLPVIHEAGIIPIAFAGSSSWSTLFLFEPILVAMNLDYTEAYLRGEHVAINDPRVAAAMNKAIEWGEKGYFGTGYTGVSEAGALLAFSKGEAAMSVEGTWNISTIMNNNPDLNFGAFQIPTNDGVRPFVGTYSNGFSIYSKTENPDAALAFLNFFASLEGQTIWVNTLGIVPGTAKIVSTNPVVNEVTQFDVVTESWYNILVRYAKEGEAPGSVWEEDQTKIFSGGTTVEAFLDELQELVN